MAMLILNVESGTLFFHLSHCIPSLFSVFIECEMCSSHRVVQVVYQLGPASRKQDGTRHSMVFTSLAVQTAIPRSDLARVEKGRRHIPWVDCDLGRNNSSCKSRSI